MALAAGVLLGKSRQRDSDVGSEQKKAHRGRGLLAVLSFFSDMG